MEESPFARNNLMRRFTAWWFDDLPPLHGILRFVFYIGLLALTQMHSKSPPGGH
jgi:hypothetical protein